MSTCVRHSGDGRRVQRPHVQAADLRSSRGYVDADARRVAQHWEHVGGDCDALVRKDLDIVAVEEDADVVRGALGERRVQNSEVRDSRVVPEEGHAGKLLRRQVRRQRAVHLIDNQMCVVAADQGALAPVRRRHHAHARAGCSASASADGEVELELRALVNY